MCIIKHSIPNKSSEDGFFDLQAYNTILGPSNKSDKYKYTEKIQWRKILSNQVYQKSSMRIFTSSRVGTFSKAKAFAESNNL